jgi:hypothetical protein
MSAIPITFSIAKEKVVEKIPLKTKILASIVPGDVRTYIYKTEAAYYADYQRSLFAITRKKAGWDCMRHLEILANGAIPYFLDLERCPEKTLYLYPKALLACGNKLYHHVKNMHTIEEIPSEILNEIYELITELLTYTREHLTTEKVAKYILEKSNFPFFSKEKEEKEEEKEEEKGKETKTTNILFLSGNTSPDYLRCVTLHGFKTMSEKIHCHDYPKVPHIYKDKSINYSALYGKGITYTNLLDVSCHDSEKDKRLIKDIENHQYDMVVYGSFHRGMPFWKLVNNYYAKEKIVLLCGEDCGGCNVREHQMYSERGYFVFVREL